MAYVNVAEPFCASVAAYPDKTAVIHKDRKITYAQMNSLVNKTAHVLLGDLGVRPGDKVAYLLPNSPEILIIYYAIQKIGAVAVPLNFKLLGNEVEHLVLVSDAKVLFFASQLAEKARQVSENKTMGVSLVAVEEGSVTQAILEGAQSYTELIEVKTNEEPILFQDESALSRIQYTGGSSGIPKGAARTHRADLVEFEGILDSNRLAQSTDNVVLIQCPLEHHGGHSWFTISFAAGATLVICDAFNAESILHNIEKHKVTYMILLPPITYLRLLACPTIDSYDLSSVKLVQSSAGGTTKEVIQAIYEHFPNAVLNYGWGQSESGLGTSLVITREMLKTDSPLLGSIGRPMKGLDIKLVDEHGIEVATGIIGEALVRSEAVMECYYGAPELTAEVFTKDGWLHTGDMMVQDEEGYLTIKSRKKDMIKSGGENVFIAEVEKTINSHPLVADCLVFGTDDPIMGEAVAAVVQLHEGSSLPESELQDFCKHHIASYKKPRYIVYIDDLGRDDAGKVRQQKVIDYFTRNKKDLSARPYEKVHSAPDVYMIPVPFTGSPTKYSNIFLIKTDDRNVLIDAGTSQERSLCALKTALHDLEVDMDWTDILLTHFHLDHIGLVRSIARPGTRIFLSVVDSCFIEHAYERDYREMLFSRLFEEGMDEEQGEVLRAYTASLLSPSVLPERNSLSHLSGGGHFQVGPYSIEVIDVPGHTPGHQCFYLPASKIMFYGDHLLLGVSPSVTVWPGSSKALENYLDSLDVIADFPVELACMGHGSVDVTLKTEGLVRRINWLKQHHERRLEEIVSVITDHPGANGTEIARRISWNTPFATWEEVSIMQRVVMILETIAHLEYLMQHGVIERNVEDGIGVYHKMPTE